MTKEKREITGKKHEILRGEKGHFIKGVSANPDGKPEGTKSYLKLLEEALERQAKEEGISYWDKLAKWSFRNPSVAVSILKKYIPDKNQTEITGAEPIEITIKHESTS